MRRKLLAWVLTLVICLTLIPPAQAHAAVNGMIRVRLDSMGSVSTTGTMSVSGSYTASGSSGQITLSKGDRLQVSASGSQLTMTYNGQSYAMGSSFTLAQNRDASGNTGLITLNNTRFSTRSYQGDFTFYASGSTLSIVNTIYIENYLYGVVGNEMDNAWPLEALKAQAIAARSYAYMEMSSSGTYDIGDTTNDQVYKGYRASDNVVMRAVNETAGMLLTYGGQPFMAYYAASNGGETDTPAHVWSDRTSPACYVVKQDPYDVANPDSLVAHIYFTNKGSTNKSGVNTLICNKIASQYGVSASSVTVVSYTDVTLTNPKYAGSINYQTAVISGTASLGGSYVNFSVSANIMNELKSAGSVTEDLRMARVTNSGNGIIYLDYCRYGHGVGLSQRGAQYMARDLGMSYQDILGFYYVGAQLQKYDFVQTQPGSVSSGVITPSGSSSGAASSGSEAIAFAYTTAKVQARTSASTGAAVAYTVEKDKMVSIHEIAGDWYRIVIGGKSGYIQKQYTTDYNALTEAGRNPGNSAGGSSAPVTNAGSSGSTGSTVTNTGSVGSTSGSAGLIQTGSATGEVQVTDNLPRTILTTTAVVGEKNSTTAIGILMAKTQVYVLSTTPTVCLVTDGTVVGWVPVTAVSNMSDWVAQACAQSSTASGTTTGTTVTNPATPATARTRTSIRLRAGEGTNYSSLMTIPGGKTVELLSKGSTWSKVSYSGQTGYVMTSYLENFVGTPSETVASGTTTPTATVQIAQTTANVRMRSGAGTTNNILATLAKGTTVSVLSRGSEWSQVSCNGMTGYVINTYLKFNTGEQTTNGKTMVTTGKVNLRSAASMDSEVLTEVPAGTQVQVYSEANDFSQVSFGGLNGYIASKYLRSAGTTTAGSSAATGKSVRVLTSVKLRSGEGTNFTSLTTIPGGSTVTLLNEGSVWCQVRYGSQTGFIMTKYIEGLSATATTSTVATTTATVNLRAGEGTGYSSLAKISKGTQVTLVNKGSEWSKVKYATYTGYIKNDYLNFGGTASSGASSSGNASSGSTSSGGAAASGEQLAVTANVNLRKGPATSYESLATIPSGTKVTVLEKGSSWSRVVYNGVEGYISSKFLSDPSASTATNSTLKFWIMQTTAQVIMRKSASDSAEQVVIVPAGTTVTVLEKGTTWSKFIYDKKIGYCKTQYLAER